MLQQRQKDIEFRQEIYEKIQKVENEKGNITQHYEKALSQKRTLEGDLERLQNKINHLEKTLKEDRYYFQ